MSSFHFNAPVNGPVQAGDHTTMNVNAPGVGADAFRSGDARAVEAVVALAERLVDVLAREEPRLLPQAEAVRTELERGGQQGAAAPDTGRIRQRLDLITSGVAAGSGALALVEGIVHAMGG
ncbi:hypothetical protein [Streptomyces sp. NPDC021020]|uniref:hypothetical protein n=1 Tax=Streptomyces sp. NPDC021020 TaxID=3365109 RepID=UPI00379E452E